MDKFLNSEDIIVGSDGLIGDIIFEGSSWYGGTGMTDFDGI